MITRLKYILQKSNTICFWSVVLLFGLFWTFVPPVVIPNYRPDLLEMLIVGQNWVLATYKHGAFTTWLVEIFYTVFQRTSWSPYLASQFCVVLSLLGLWQIGKVYLSSKNALLAVFCMLGFYFFHFESTLYNNHTTLILFWICSTLFLLYALHRNKVIWWVLTGVSIGVGLYCKLTMAVWVISVLVFILLDRSVWWNLRKKGPWLTFIVSLLIFLPFLRWMIEHDFVNFKYARESGTGITIQGYWSHVKSPVEHIFSQLLYIIPIIFPLYFLPWDKTAQFKNRIWESGDNRLLTILIFIPFSIQFLTCILSGSEVRAALGMHCWLFLPIWLLTIFGNNEVVNWNTDTRMRTGYRRAFRTTIIIQLVIILVFILGIPLSPAITGRGSRYHFPGRQMACLLEEEWNKRYSEPLSFVRGDYWLTENASVYANVRPIYWDEQWSSEDDFRTKGGIYLWNEKDENRQDVITRVKQQWPQAEILPTLILKQQTCFAVPPVNIGFAIIPPRK